MSTAGRSRSRGKVRAAVALAAALTTVLAGCGANAPAPPGAASTTTTSSLASTGTPTNQSPTSSSPSPTTTQPVDVLVPASVLERSLATKVLAKAYTVEQSDSGDYPTTGGLTISSMGEYVSGDRGCLGLFNAHSPSPEAFAYVSMSNKTSWFEEVAESYPSVAAARYVMAENVSQARTCRSLKMRVSEGEVVTYRHTVTARKNADLDVDLFLHHFNGRTTQYTYEFHLFEGRVDGELMNILWGSTTLRSDPSSAAFTQFQKVVNAYRKAHPRPDTAATGGVSPVVAVPERAGSPSSSLTHRRLSARPALARPVARPAV